MKKGRVLLSAILVIMIVYLQPGVALAGNARQVFLENLNTIANQEVQFDVSQPMVAEMQLHFVPSGSIAEISPDMMLQSVDVDMDMAVDAVNEKMWMRVGVDVPGLDPAHYDIEAFVEGNRIIVPMAVVEQFPVEDIPEGVQYVYIEDETLNMSESYDMILQNANQNIACDPQLFELLFRPVPDSNFSVNGSTASVDINKLALLSFINAFNDPDYVQAWADELSKWLPEEYFSSEDIADEIQGGTAVELTLDDLQGLELRSMKTSVGTDWLGMDYDLGYSDDEAAINGKMEGLVYFKPDRTTSDYKINIDFTEEAPSVSTFNLDAVMHQEMKRTGAISNGNLSFVAQEEQEQMGFEAGFRSSANVVERIPVIFPVLTEENSFEIPLGPEEPEMTTLIFQGQEHGMFDPFIQNGRLMVSSFDLGLALDLEMDRSNENQIILSGQDKVMEFTAGDTTMKVNGTAKTMDVAPVYQDYEIYVPIRFVVEELGYQVTYDSEARVITVQ